MAATMTRTAAALGRSGLLGVVERRAGITPSGLLAIALAVVGWALARVLGGRGLYLLVYSSVLALAASVIVARRPRALEAQRSEVVRRAREGQSLDIEL